LVDGSHGRADILELLGVVCLPGAETEKSIGQVAANSQNITQDAADAVNDGAENIARRISDASDDAAKHIPHPAGEAADDVASGVGKAADEAWPAVSVGGRWAVSRSVSRAVSVRRRSDLVGLLLLLSGRGGDGAGEEGQDDGGDLHICYLKLKFE